MAEVLLQTLPIDLQVELDSRPFVSGRAEKEIEETREALLAVDPNTIAAVLALRNGGWAFAPAQARLPRQNSAVTLFRY